MRSWWLRGVSLVICALPVAAQRDDLARLARRYLSDLVRINTTNPPGNETAVAEYVRRSLAAEGFTVELLGENKSRLNVVTRLSGSGGARPLLLMAHSDVVPADRTQWSADPFAAEVRNGLLYGRGAQDDKSLLAAEMAVLVELKKGRTRHRRDVILLSEADEEAGSTGIRWMIANAWNKIDADLAFNEGGTGFRTDSGVPIFQIQTSEKIPTRVVVTAHGTAGHGSLPRSDNAVVHLARAVVRLTDADQPVSMNATTRRYLRELSALEPYAWLGGLLRRLEDPVTSTAAAGQVMAHQPELAAMLRTTVSPTMLDAGIKINVIPNVAVARVDARRLPNESREEVLDRFRRIINDSSVEVSPAGGQEMPATEPSSVTSPVYLAMERVLADSTPRAIVVPYLSRGATDGAFLRQKGMAVYGPPIFFIGPQDNRAHGNDEFMRLVEFDAGVRRLLDLVVKIIE